MALIAMAVHDTVENGRTWMTEHTLESLAATVDWSKHRLIVVDNGSCEATRVALGNSAIADVLRNETNLGTARAINRAWKERRPGEHAVKIDNDVVIHQPGWLDRLEECIAREPGIGIIGLKRKDLDESPLNPEGRWDHSELVMLPHKLGERWLIVERVHHVMGTCQLYSSALLDKIGYLYQPGLYGFDDSLAAARCEVAGFWSCFYPHVEIDHIDPGGTVYQDWKQRYAGEQMQAFFQLRQSYQDGSRSIYHGPDDV